MTMHPWISLELGTISVPVTAKLVKMHNISVYDRDIEEG